MRTPVHVVIAVWGEEYARLCLRVLLPSLLTPGNLPALRGSMDALLRIYTLPGERSRFEGTPELARVREVLPVEVLEVVVPPPAASHDENIGAMVQLHRRAIEECERIGAAMVFVSPDMVFADGALATLARLAAGGARAVLVASLRLTREDFLAEYPAALLRAGPRGLDARALVSLALRHLHPLSLALVWGGPTLADCPTMLLWRAGDAGFVGRFFHLHPIYVHPERRGTRVASSIDDAYVSNACPDPRTIVVLEDTDDLALFELTSKQDVEVWWRREPRSVLSVAVWAYRGATRLHRAHFRRTIAIRAAGGDPGDWRRATQAAARTARAVAGLARLRVGFVPLAWDRGRKAITASVVRAKSALGIEGSLLARSPGDDPRPRA